MKKPKPPNSKEEIIDYIRERRLCVDPDFFWDYFSEADWYDSQGKPVLSWKQKLLTWHRKAIERIRPHKCSYPSCPKLGVYPVGYDIDGHPYFRCIEHKPKEKCHLPKELTIGLLKTIPNNNRDLNQKRNDAMKKLVYSEMEKKHG